MGEPLTPGEWMGEYHKTEGHTGRVWPDCKECGPVFAARAAAPSDWKVDKAESESRVAHDIYSGVLPPAPERAGLPRTRAIGRLNDYLSTLPVSPGRTQALVDLNVILTEDRAALHSKDGAS